MITEALKRKQFQYHQSELLNTDINIIYSTIKGLPINTVKAVCYNNNNNNNNNKLSCLSRKSIVSRFST